MDRIDLATAAVELHPKAMQQISRIRHILYSRLRFYLIRLPLNRQLNSRPVCQNRLARRDVATIAQMIYGAGKKLTDVACVLLVHAPYAPEWHHLPPA
jgi:hypothetical protein